MFVVTAFILPLFARLIRRILIALCVSLVVFVILQLSFDNLPVSVIGGFAASLIAFLWRIGKAASPMESIQGRRAKNRSDRRVFPEPVIKTDEKTGKPRALEFDEACINLFRQEIESRDEIKNYWETCHRFLYASEKYALDSEILKLRSRVATQIPRLISEYLSGQHARTDMENEIDLDDTMETIAHISKEAEELRVRILRPANFRKRLRHNLMRQKNQQDPFE